MFSAAALAILVTMALAMTRALIGPTVYEPHSGVEHVRHQNRI